MQRILCLTARAWNPEGRPSQYFVDVATKDGNGVSVSNMSVSVDVFNAISTHVPCFCDAELGIGGVFKGQAKLTLSAAKVVAKLVFPVAA